MIPQWRNIWEMELPVLNEQPIRWEKRGQKNPSITDKRKERGNSKEQISSGC